MGGEITERDPLMIGFIGNYVRKQLVKAGFDDRDFERYPDTAEWVAKELRKARDRISVLERELSRVRADRHLRKK